MAIGHISVGDVESISKINLSIDEANKVDSKADAVAVANEFARIPLAEPVNTRPGEAVNYFTSALDGGDPALLPSMDVSKVRFDDAGYVIRQAGDGIVASRALYPLEPGHKYLVEYAVQRRVNSPDPDNDAIKCALAWYDQTYGALGQVTVQNLLGVTTGSGRLTVQAVVSRAAADDVDVVSSASARYARPFVQTYGTLVQSDIEVIRWTDITNASAYSPDLTALEGRTAALESVDAGNRLTTLEGQVTAPNSMRIATVSDLAAATIAVSADTVDLLAYSDPSDPRDGGEDSRIRIAAPGVVKSYQVQSLDGAWWQSRKKWTHPEQFGAVTNPAVDSTDGFKRMRDFVQDTGAAIRLPPGKFLLRDRIAFEGQPSMFGAGIGLSQLGWDSSAIDAGILVNMRANEDDAATFENFSMIRQGVRASGTAIYLQAPDRLVSGFIQPRSGYAGILSKLDIRGTGESIDSWADCINLDTICNVKLSEVELRGSYTGQITDSSGNGIDACRGIVCGGDGHPVEFEMYSIRAYFMNEAIRIDGCEGVYLFGPTLVANKTGVRWTGSKPQLIVSGGHMNSILTSIHATDMLEGVISGTLFYNNNTVLDVSIARTAILLDGGAGVNNIIGCTFDCDKMDCIVLNDLSTLNLIGPNNFFKGKAAVKLGASSNQNVVSRGQMYNGVTSRVTDSGTGNEIPNGGVLATLSAAQTIATATSTAISWGAASQTNPNHWISGSPTRLTVQRAGVYELNASLLFATNSTGVRRLLVFVNGVALGTGSNNSVQAVAGVATSVNFVSRKLTLAAGAYVEIYAYQDSGGNLAVNTGSYAELRFDTQA